MNIAIGSTNPVKMQAAKLVLSDLFPDSVFTPLEVSSGIPAQPWGDAETRTGALNRARAAMTQTAADLAVGFEGGLIRTELGIMTCGWCAIVASDGHFGVGGGSHLMLPPEASAMLDRGIELGMVMDSISGHNNTKHGAGAIGILTNGLEDRVSAFAHILRLALAPFRSAAFYRETLS
jgi:inosine/xanthosine triphosphatase